MEVSLKILIIYPPRYHILIAKKYNLFVTSLFFLIITPDFTIVTLQYK